MSAGVSSFMAGYLSRKTVDEFIYIDIKDQHPDSIRFIKDCEKVLGKPIKILYPEYGDVDTACRVGGFINRPKVGAYCTKFLKKRVRKQWELEHSDYDITYVWGFDRKEKNGRSASRILIRNLNMNFRLSSKSFPKMNVIH